MTTHSACWIYPEMRLPCAPGGDALTRCRSLFTIRKRLTKVSASCRDLLENCPLVQRQDS